MTTSPKPFAVFIIGTGRSGTSVATQALAELGLSMPNDLIPANETNLRGFGESVAIRDRMLALSRASGVLQGLRMTEWRETDAARETTDWAADYMAERRDAAEGRGFIIKFPLSSIFLPLWLEAAERIGLDLRFLWATRGAANILRSLTQAYDRSAEAAQAIYALRSFYILRDAPGDTLLLPYEGWARAPEAQVEALARLSGATDPARREAAVSAFAGVLDHSVADAGGEPPDPIRRLDDAIRDKCGLLGDILAPGAAEHGRITVGLADLIRDLHPKGRPFHARDAMDARLTLISGLAAQTDKEAPEMKDELEILAQRIRDVNHENRELTRKLETLSAPLNETRAGRTRQTEEMADLRERTDAQNAELESLKAAYAGLTRERDAAEESARAQWFHEINRLQRREARLQKNLDQARSRLGSAKAGTQAAKLRVLLALRKLEVKRLTRRGAAGLFRAGRSEDRRQIAAVAASPHFDAAWYLKTYPDVRRVKMSPARHFVLHGVYEGRSPGPNLNTLDYYLRHPRALANGVNPVLHKERS